MLREGHLLTLDYGLPAEQFFTPARAGGTLRAYYRHHPTKEVFEHVGEQDLTAHVNFTALQEGGEAAGLETIDFLAQEKFLTEIARQTWEPGAAFLPWSSDQTRQFQTLTHPEHLGRSFQVLIQARRDRSRKRK